MADIDNKDINVTVASPLAALLAGSGNYSKRLNDVAERYRAIIADTLAHAHFSRAEWCALMDVLTGEQMADPDTPDWNECWVAVAESPELDRKWKVDHDDLARRIRAAPVVIRAAVWEAAAEFWRHPDLSRDEALAKAGIPASPPHR
jgi:hypothetical protein